jgi:Arc/MetJ family transcription regulator
MPLHAPDQLRNDRLDRLVGTGVARILLDMAILAILDHMKTTLNIDDELLREAQRLTGLAEKTAVVRAGLEALIALESQKRLAALGGTEKGLRAARRRRARA